jgi:glycine betaine/proline transport system substrate-binding protein
MDVIRLGYRDSALHEASAAAVARVLEAHDVEVEPLPIAPDRLAAELAGGGIDLFASAWLPSTDAALLDATPMEPLGLLYRPAFIWTIAAGEPSSIADLSDAAALDRRILVPASGPMATLAGSVLAAYGLGAAGFRIDTVSDPEAQEWAEALDPTRVVPLCRPHALLHVPGLHELGDPLAALGPEQEARLLIRSEIRGVLDSDLIDELDELTLGNKVVSAMAHAMQTGGMSAEEAADAWQRGKLSPRA